MEPVLRCGKYELLLHQRTHIMGILNVTPDSFSNGGKYNTVETAVKQAHRMVEEGADIVDIGGESSRPGSLPVSEEIEIERVIPVVRELVRELDIPISIDTTKSVVAEKALALGAQIINDISGLRSDPAMVQVIRDYTVPVVIMHMKGAPYNMQENPSYQSLLEEISEFFLARIEYASECGIPSSHIIIDPGIGFGKMPVHNLEIIRRLDYLLSFKRPLLIGPSRKSVINHVLHQPVEDRLDGTAALVACAVLKGAHIVRVHDVRKMAMVVRMVDAVNKGLDYKEECKVR